MAKDSVTCMDVSYKVNMVAEEARAKSNSDKDWCSAYQKSTGNRIADNIRVLYLKIPCIRSGCMVGMKPIQQKIIPPKIP